MDFPASTFSFLIHVGVLSGVALWLRYRGKLAEAHFPPAGQFVEVGGVPIHYIEKGSGPPVVFLHGNGTQCQDFLACGLLDRLSRHYRVIAFDRPGFGHTPRPRGRLWTPKAQARLLAQACTALGVAHPTLVGHSWGTQTALAMAMEKALPVRGLVLVSGYYFPDLRPLAWLAGIPALPLVGDILCYTAFPLLAHMTLRSTLAKLFAPDRVARRFVERVPPALMLRPWQIRASAEESAFLVVAAAGLSRRYGSIEQPVEIFAGVADHLVRQSRQSGRLHARLPNSKLHLLPSEGHMLHYSAGERIAQAVDRIARAEPLFREGAAGFGTAPLSPA